MSPERQSTSFAAARRLVIKIGSALLVDEDRGVVHRAWLQALAEDVAAARARGQEVLIVSSGAIAVGRQPLGFDNSSLRLEEKQAAAATGMIRLAHAYQNALGVYDLTVAQILLTLFDTEHRRRYINARATLNTLLAAGAIPLINENDTVATDEIRYGDNDRLAARVAAMVEADTLVLLSDIDGLYTADPRIDPSASPIPVVQAITDDIEAMAGAASPGHGSGGMVTKLAAARIAMSAGCRMVIADGKPPHPLARLADSARCTWFLPHATPQTARKRWIAGSLSPLGSITIDEGAVRALSSGKSLLPAGVVEIVGDFEKGDAVIVRDRDGRELGRGLVKYTAADARIIKGGKTVEIAERLGYRGPKELIHRDDLALR